MSSPFTSSPTPPARESLWLLLDFFRNILAILGLAVVGGGGIFYVQGQQATHFFDDKFIMFFSRFVEQVLKKDMASALVIKIALEKEVTLEQAIQSMKLYAHQLNLKFTASYPLHKEIERATGQTSHFIEIFEFCEANVVSSLLQYNADFAGYLPYRIVLYEDSQNQRWLATLNMELLLHATQGMNSEVKKQALKIQDNLLKIMGASASGA